MAVGWFLANLERWHDVDRPAMVAVRHAVWRDFGDAIRADGGTFREVEVLGGKVIVKVRASAATLQAIAATAGVQRLPKDHLDDPLSDLTNAQKIALRDLVEGCGFTRAEWQAALGTDLGAKSLRDVLDFMRSRRQQPRYDQPSDTVIWNGKVETPEPLASVDGAVSDN